MVGQGWKGQDKIYREDRMISPGLSVPTKPNPMSLETASTFYRNMMEKHINLKWLPFVIPEQTPNSLNLGKDDLTFPLRIQCQLHLPSVVRAV